jgi:hypothetical protein
MVMRSPVTALALEIIQVLQLGQVLVAVGRVITAVASIAKVHVVESHFGLNDWANRA